MRTWLIALSIPLIVAANSPANPTPKKIIVARTLCQPKTMTPAQESVADGTEVQRARPLSEMPPAKQQLAVIRTIDGCEVPTVVRYNIGGN